MVHCLLSMSQGLLEPLLGLGFRVSAFAAPLGLALAAFGCSCDGSLLRSPPY